MYITAIVNSPPTLFTSAIVYLDTSPLCVRYKRRVRTSRSKAGNRGIRRRPRPVPWKCVPRACSFAHIHAPATRWWNIVLAIKAERFSVENALQHLQDKSLIIQRHFSSTRRQVSFRSSDALTSQRFSALFIETHGRIFAFFFMHELLDSELRIPCGFFDWQWFIPVRWKCTRPNAYRAI